MIQSNQNGKCLINRSVRITFFIKTEQLSADKHVIK